MAAQFCAAAACLVLLTSACATQATTSAPARTVDDALVQQQAPGAAALGGFAALQAAGQVPSAGVIVPECVPRSGAPYQIGAVGSFSGGSVKVIDGVSVSGISGRFCAVATLVAAPPTHPTAKVCAQLVAPKSGLQFDPVQTDINLIPTVTSVIAQVQVVPETFTAYVCDDGVPGVLALSTTIQASAAPQVFGTRCEVGPLQAAVTGTFTGPLTNATATLTSGAFPVQAVQAGPLCPEGLARNTNAILGLPLSKSVAGLSITTTAALYRAK